MKIQLVAETRKEEPVGLPIPAALENGMLTATARWKDLIPPHWRKEVRHIVRLILMEEDGTPVMMIPVQRGRDGVEIVEGTDTYLQFGDDQFGLMVKIERSK